MDGNTVYFAFHVGGGIGVKTGGDGVLLVVNNADVNIQFVEGIHKCCQRAVAGAGDFAFFAVSENGGGYGVITIIGSGQ